MDGRLIARMLAEPGSTAGLDAAGWTALLTMARAEQLLGSLAHRLEDVDVPAAVRPILADARAAAAQSGRAARWEAEMARRALAPLGVSVVLLKGAAYHAAGLDAAAGRFVGDLDILVPWAALGEVERALCGAGWSWVKDDPYDDAYYRRWMHELPPLIHAERDAMIDVHHTILPPTARPTPDAAALLADSVVVDGGVAVLSREDMVVHAALHLFADGDLAGGLRNLWDIDRLLRQFAVDEEFWARLQARALRHEALPAVLRAGRQAHALFGTPLPEGWRVWDSWDPLFARRLTARDGWGRTTRPGTRFACYVRSHWLRMPSAMLARHLWIKWRRGAPASG